MKTLDINQYYTEAETHVTALESVITTFKQQSQALALMAGEVDCAQYNKALDYMLTCKGHIIICGMGKSGHVGRKIAATLASTGTPSFFLHPSEAFHGDLGMITSDDVIILISNSGETDEVLQLIPSLKSFGNRIIAVTGKINSTLSSNADATLLLAQTAESCPNNLAPTTSTTATIALGDALAVALMNERKFQPNDFARFHPGGSLGRRLLTRVEDVMAKDQLPIVDINDPMSSVVMVMNQSRKGLAIVTERRTLIGIITDGDLRRALAKEQSFTRLKAREVMSGAPKVCYQSEMLTNAEAAMRKHAISSLVVLNDSEQICGLIQLIHTQ
ncbi:KpsF/GutQ family sugar-phosphate isomerase [Salinivibrio kushneri]|uniref:KpsF/GutQ family sugar-phosphate isomerase n=1 Tax=Salinivibrio kushneri TaxID=1908198 RepID=UPI000C832B5E|nr:KpsF/GutQ family sugar-phosphate isomerase [Salinivibrio kushneri]